MVEENFDFEEENFEDFPEEPVQKQQVQAPRGKSQMPQARKPQPQSQPQRNVVQTQASASAPVTTPDKSRYSPYMLAPRIGIFDNLTGKPIMESADSAELQLAINAEILNRLDRIEQGL